MRYFLKYFISFMAGMLSCNLIFDGITTYARRRGAVGGEVLILPLIFLLLLVGYQYGCERGYLKGKAKGREIGFKEGFEEGYFEAESLDLNIKEIKKDYKEKTQKLTQVFDTMSRADEVIARAKRILNQEAQRNGDISSRLKGWT